MILIGIGSNLPSDKYGSSIDVCEAALIELEHLEITIAAKSNWYETAPIPVSNQPNYINGVIAVETTQNSSALLAALQSIEQKMGRIRTEKNAARVIDLDLLAYGAEIKSDLDLVIPHPRIQERAFVVYPIFEIAPNWQHPVSGLGIGDIKNQLPNQEISQISV